MAGILDMVELLLAYGLEGCSDHGVPALTPLRGAGASTEFTPWIFRTVPSL